MKNSLVLDRNVESTVVGHSRAFASFAAVASAAGSRAAAMPASVMSAPVYVIATTATHANGLACSPCPVAKKQDRKNNWHGRPLIGRGGFG